MTRPLLTCRPAHLRWCAALAASAALLGCMGSDAAEQELPSTLPAQQDGAPSPSATAREDESASSLPSSAELDAGAATVEEQSASEPACTPRTIDVHGAAPDMLIVLDRSLSMSLNRRWEPSKRAVKSITRDFGGLIRFGMSVFPGDGGECAEGRLDVPLDVDNSAAISQLVDRTQTSGLTPTGPALSQALRLLGDRTLGSDAATQPAYVLLVTDGEPNCRALPLFPDTAQQESARAAVRALREKNIPTYVIGYQIEAAHQGMMNDLAVLGGTSRYRPVESGEQIVASFAEIAKEVITCSFDLGEAPDPRRLLIELDQQPIALGASDGWTLEDQTLTLQGGACAKLKDGQAHALSARLECREVLLD